MSRRKILVLVAVLIAAIGTGTVFMYVKGADSRADQRFSARQVLVAAQAINPGETMTAAKAAGKLKTTTVSAGSVVAGALTDPSAVPDSDVALSTIYAGEQILPGKFGAAAGAADASIEIPKGDTAISIQLDDPARVAGFVNPGNKVVIFATKQSADGDATKGGTQVLLPGVTVTAVGSTTTIPKTTTDPSGAQTVEQLPRTIITLALDQTDAQKVIFAQGNGYTLTFGLLSKDTEIAKTMPPTNAGNLFN